MTTKIETEIAKQKHKYTYINRLSIPKHLLSDFLKKLDNF